MAWKIELTSNKEISADDYTGVRDTVLAKFPDVNVSYRLGSGKVMELSGSYSTVGQKATAAGDTAKSLLEIKGYVVNSSGIRDAVAPAAPNRSGIILLSR